MVDPLTPVDVDHVCEDDIPLFGEYRQLYPIIINGSVQLVPERNSVLRALQFLEIRRQVVKLDWSRYCWNDTDGCCDMQYRCSGETEIRTERACRVQVRPGLEIVKLPKGRAAR